MEGFPGGPVIKSPRANTGNTSSIPGPGESQFCRAKLLCAAATEPVH